ncbi:MAG: hypothetical protein AB4042_07680 [Leptolyngbyaceae cyanobacterium]
MLTQKVVRQCALAIASLSVAFNSGISGALAQSAAERSIEQAAYNTGLRLQHEGYVLRSLDGALTYQTFIANGASESIRFNVPYTGNFVLAIGGDHNTADLDLYFPQINGGDTSFGPTGFSDFNVYRPGEFYYTIDMVDCQAAVCGVYAIVLEVTP